MRGVFRWPASGGNGVMATHQVQLSLQRAARRPRGIAPLSLHAAIASGCAGVVGAGGVYVGVKVLELGWRMGIGLAVLGTAGVVAAAGMLGARLSASLEAASEAARLVASGDFRVQAPSGPGREVARLGDAFNHMAVTVAEDLRLLRETIFSLEEMARRAKAEADARARELESFLHVAAHDLRGPVLSIQGFANLLSRSGDRRLDEVSREHLLRIRTNAEAMEVLLRDLLEVARVGRVQEPREWVDSGEILAAVLRELEPEARQFRVRVKVAADLPMVAYAPRLLARVFRNLVENAMKFMGDQPSPMVVVGCERTAQGHRFFVRDNGVGVKAEDAERVFGLFERGEGMRGRGSGIGLTIVQRIVKAHGGRVWVESRPGEGSTFWFTVSGAARPGGSTAHLETGN